MKIFVIATLILYIFRFVIHSFQLGVCFAEDDKENGSLTFFTLIFDFIWISFASYVLIFS